MLDRSSIFFYGTQYVGFKKTFGVKSIDNNNQSWQLMCSLMKLKQSSNIQEDTMLWFDFALNLENISFEVILSDDIVIHFVI